MSNTDFDTTPQADQAPPPSRPESYEQHGVDVSEVFRDPRLDRQSEIDFSSTRDAADEVIRRRKSTELQKDHRDVELAVAVVPWDDPGTGDPRSSATLSDTRRLAETLAERRDERKRLAAEYLEGRYGEPDSTDYSRR